MTADQERRDEEPTAGARAVRARLAALARLSPGPRTAIHVALVVQAIATVGGALRLAAIVDALLRQRPHLHDVGVDLAWLAAFVLMRATAAGIVEWGAQRMATRAKGQLRRAAVEAIVTRGPRWRRAARRAAPAEIVAGEGVESERTGAIVADAIDGVEALDPYFRRYLPQRAAAVIGPLVVLLAVAALDPASGVLLAVTGPLVVAFMWLIGSHTERQAQRQWRTLRDLSGRFLETLRGLPTALLFARGRDLVERLDASGDAYRRATMNVLRVAFLSGLVLDLATTVSTALVAVSVGIRLIEGWMPFERGFVVLLLTPEFFAPLRLLGQRHHAGMEGAAAAERLFAWIGEPAAPAAAPMAPTAGGPRQPVASGGEREGVDGSSGHDLLIRFDGVGFRHGETGFALESIDFELPPRTLTAIVGPSGAGKSTILDLLLRFGEPDVGSITANGRSIADLDPRAWRGQLAFVPQRPQFIDASVLDNLRLGSPGASIDVVRAAARRAAIEDFVDRLPHGFEASLGEMAARASVGERQRLALARALLRDAAILLVDEPSSALDPITEAAITRALADESRRRTVLVVAHRLHTVRAAGQLLVLDRGRLVGRGRHDDLIGANGLYARLVAAAAASVSADRDEIAAARSAG